MAVTRNEDGKRQYIRYAYMNEKYYAKELEDFVKEQKVNCLRNSNHQKGTIRGTLNQSKIIDWFGVLFGVSK